MIAFHACRRQDGYMVNTDRSSVIQDAEGRLESAGCCLQMASGPCMPANREKISFTALHAS